MSNDTAMQTSPEVKRAQKRVKSSSQRRTKRKVFDERQTDEERRLLRVEQRNIHHVLATGAYRTRKRGGETENDDEEEEEERPTLEGVRDTNNELFHHVTYTRELVLDADNVVLLANNYAKQVEQSVQVPRYDAIKVISALKKQCTMRKDGNTFFDWATLGVQTGVCYNAVPSKVSFAAGKYEVGIAAKPKKAREAKVKDTSEAVRPDEEKVEAKGDKATMSVADACVLKLRKRILKDYTANINIKEGAPAPEPLDPLEILLDPKSFTKTVENFFYFSFLIKRGHAGVDKNWGIRCEMSKDNETMGEHRQAFVHLNKKTWKRMCAELEARKQAVA
ncbi:hypothetical protein FisN_13Lh244 [Fistulifera solaris]|uniref:Non-structural maintenance of chromosomes element 4 n=1 Tax=Fistulifera solaris TaxID=1519565 RepID=A0A1Z5KLL0_FISSO|nr:hypothetical protein FisN_13Lh244 [Fistulifera solaris]|eukprot:GAX27203.1 hypothetical protein FisN_13Lh244 [Fistulifera solaris]